jgi:hypothetical protein
VLLRLGWLEKVGYVGDGGTLTFNGITVSQ